MKVEIWSDFACPFCYIGKKRLELALQSFPHRDKVEITYRSFELNPDAEYTPGLGIHEMLSRKYGMSVEQARANNDRLAAQAAELGLAFDFDAVKLGNTFDAHRLMLWADSISVPGTLTDRLFRAYFEEGRLLQDREVLAAIAGEAGLHKEEAAAMLASDRYAAEVRADEQEAAALGVQGVPFYVLGRKYGISGAQPPSVFVQALEQAWSESMGASADQPEAEAGSSAGVCVDEACAVPPQEE